MSIAERIGEIDLSSVSKGKGAPKGTISLQTDNFAVLLVQGLESSDANILNVSVCGLWNETFSLARSKTSDLFSRRLCFFNLKAFKDKCTISKNWNWFLWKFQFNPQNIFFKPRLKVLLSSPRCHYEPLFKLVNIVITFFFFLPTESFSDSQRDGDKEDSGSVTPTCCFTFGRRGECQFSMKKCQDGGFCLWLRRRPRSSVTLSGFRSDVVVTV